MRPSINLALTQNVLRGQPLESVWMTVQTQAPLLAHRVALHMIFSFSESHFFFFNLENADGEDLPQKDITKHKKTKELRDYSDSYYRKLRMTQDSLYHVLVYGRSPLSK